MHTTRSLVALVAAALVLHACGKKEEPSASSGAAPAEQPVQGRSVSRPNQIQGAWMATTAGDLDGVEFLKDNQAMLTRAGGRGTVTLSSNILDDGRLSLTNPQGVTTLYRTTISGDTLELVPENAGAAQRFARIKPGQTLAEAIREHEQKMLEEMRQRILALRELVRHQDAVLVPDPGQGVEWQLALKIDNPDASLNGTLVFIEQPGKVTPLAPARAMPLRADTAPGDPRAGTVAVNMQAAPPATVFDGGGVGDAQGPIRLTISGPVDKPVVAGTAHFAGLAPGPVRVTLQRDADAHRAAVEAQRAHWAGVEAEVERLASFLGGRSVFAGARTQPGAEDRPVRLVIERAEAGGLSAIVTDPAGREQPAQAGIDLVLGVAALYVTTPWGEQWRLQTAAGADTLEGLWRPNARAEFLGHGSVSLGLERRWTREEVAAERAAIERFLTQDLRSPQRFVGFVERRHGAVNAARWPVSVEIQNDGSGALTGSAWIVSHRGGVTLQGTLAGRTANLAAQQVLPDSVDFARLATQRWQLELAGIDPVATFAGRMSSNMGGGGEVVLERVTPESSARLRERLVEALTRARYAARTADTSSVRDEQVFFVFDRVDEASGRVSGRILGDGSKWRSAPPADFEGDIVDEHGVPLLRLTVRGAPDPARGRGETPDPFTLELAAFELDGVLRLTGSTPPGPGNQDWITLDPIPSDADIPMDPARSVRLAALRLGASAVPARFSSPSPGDEMLVLVSITERDARVGQLFYADGRYTHGNSVESAALHAGLARPGELGVFRLTFHEPFTEPVEAHEANGVTTQRGTFRANNTVPTFRIERVAID